MNEISGLQATYEMLDKALRENKRVALNNKDLPKPVLIVDIRIHEQHLQICLNCTDAWVDIREEDTVVIA